MRLEKKHHEVGQDAVAAQAQPCAELSDDELESHIVDCGHLMEAAMAFGNREAAYSWLKAQNFAISQRSPTKKAQLAAEFERRLNEGADYFAYMGRLHAQQRQEATQ